MGAAARNPPGLLDRIKTAASSSPSTYCKWSYNSKDPSSKTKAGKSHSAWARSAYFARKETNSCKSCGLHGTAASNECGVDQKSGSPDSSTNRAREEGSWRRACNWIGPSRFEPAVVLSFGAEPNSCKISGADNWGPTQNLGAYHAGLVGLTSTSTTRVVGAGEGEAFDKPVYLVRSGPSSSSPITSFDRSGLTDSINRLRPTDRVERGFGRSWNQGSPRKSSPPGRLGIPERTVFQLRLDGNVTQDVSQFASRRQFSGDDGSWCVRNALPRALWRFCQSSRSWMFAATGDDHHGPPPAFQHPSSQRPSSPSCCDPGSSSFGSGEFDLAHLLCLQEEPPATVFSNRQANTLARTRAFSPLADQKWITVALAYVKELDVITSQRLEITNQPRPGPSGGGGEGDRPKPKANPKKKQKGAGKGSQNQGDAEEN